jgi:hypothetical protein
MVSETVRINSASAIDISIYSDEPYLKFIDIKSDECYWFFNGFSNLWG